MSKRAEIRMARKWNRSQRKGELARERAYAEFAAMSRQMTAASTFADSMVALALSAMATGQRMKYRPNPQISRDGGMETK